MLIETNKDSSGSSRQRRKAVPTPPDGGWGWWVVAASFLIHIVADGVAYTFGLFFVKISEDLHESKSATSWIASIMAGMTYGIGPFAGAVVNRFGCRPVSIVGSFIAAFGFAISYFAQSVTFLYFSVGIVGGLGLGLIYLPAIVCVTCYFEKKRAFATGIAVCGSGFGTFLLAPLIEYLIRVLGWRVSFIVTGGIILTCFIFSCFFKPLEEFETDEEDEEESALDTTAAIPCIVEPDDSEVKKPLMSNGNAVVGNGTVLKSNQFNLVINDTLTMSCSQPALRLASECSSDSLPRFNERLSTKRHSLKTLPFGSGGQLAPSTKHPHHQHNASSHGVILQRKDIFYSGSLMRLPTSGDTEEAQVRPSWDEKNPKDLDNFDDCDDTSSSTSNECVKALKTMMDLSILRDPVFLFFAFSNFFTSIGYNVPYIYLVDKAAGESSAPKNDIKDAGFLLSIVGISNTLSRVLLGYLSDKPWVNRLYLYNIALTICGIATGLCSHTDNLHLLQLYAATFGATVGVYVSLTSVILVDLLGLEKLTNAFGLLLLFQGIATVIGPPIVGKLFDEFGDYRYGFWLAGGMIAISGLMLFLVPLIERKKRGGDNSSMFGTNNEHIVIKCKGSPGPDDEKDIDGRRKVSNNNLSKF